MRSFYRTMDTSISGRIQQRLDALKLSPRAASLAASLSADAIRNIQRAERGNKPYDPKAGTLAKLAVVLGTTEEWLMHGRGVETVEMDRVAQARLALATASSRSSRQRFEGRADQTNSIPEVDVRAGMGPGGNVVEEMYVDEDGSGQHRDAVRAHWGIPDYYLRENRLDPKFTDILEASGTSNEPDLRAGDRLIVDRRHRVPSPDGYYALWDGFGVVVKALQLVPNTDPPIVRIASANPLFAPYERSAEEINIIGKITHVIKRL